MLLTHWGIVSFVELRAFQSFWMHLEFSFALPTFWEPTRDI